MLNYTPLDLHKLSQSNSPVLKQHKPSLNFLLLFIAIVTAVVFAVLLFVLIQKRRGEANITVPEVPIMSPTAFPTTPVLLTPTLIPTEDVISASADLMTPLASVSPTLAPKEAL